MIQLSLISVMIEASDNNNVPLDMYGSTILTEENLSTSINDTLINDSLKSILNSDTDKADKNVDNFKVNSDTSYDNTCSLNFH